jgi:hypothetical protein
MQGCIVKLFTVDYAGMDRTSGRFTVVQPGVYQLTFTAFFAALRGHMVRDPAFTQRYGLHQRPIISYKQYFVCPESKMASFENSNAFCSAGFLLAG